jgi:hypothetical protein
MDTPICRSQCQHPAIINEQSRQRQPQPRRLPTLQLIKSSQSWPTQTPQKGYAINIHPPKRQAINFQSEDSNIVPAER